MVETMDNNQTVNLELIRQAQAGHATSQTRLTELTEQTVFPYLYRLTFDFHLAQDLCQEALMEMIRSLARLELAHEGAYWAWIYRTALSKAQKHFRRCGNQRLRIKGVESMQTLAQQMIDGQPNQVDSLIQEELLGAVLKAMHTLRFSYRNILTLRCLQGLSYAEIATILGHSQLAARLQFFKAKQALQRKLNHNGFGPGYLLSGLTLLAGTTAVSRSGTALAAGSIGAGMLKIPFATMSLGWLVSKTGALVAVLFTAAAVWVGVSQSKPREVTSSQLTTLVAKGSFACPTAILDMNDPQNLGIYRVNVTSDHPVAQTASAEDVPDLLHIENPDFLRLYHHQRIQLSFNNDVLIDGPGPDLYIIASGCRGFSLHLIQENQPAIELVKLLCPGWRFHHQQHIMPFDLKDIPADTRPTSLELIVDRGVIETCGLEIHSICARIER
jgi:RNA polymerase sigma-70 factor (ECF subfamily)